MDSERYIRPQSQFKSVGLVLTRSLIDELNAESKRQALSMSALVREALRGYLKTLKREEA